MLFFGYCATILDCDSAVLESAKKISMTSNVLPLHFAPSQASSSQNSNVDNMLEGYKMKSALPYKNFSILASTSALEMTQLSNVLIKTFDKCVISKADISAIKVQP